MPDSQLQDLQLDGLPGPTHHYGGLGTGNLASQAHAGWTSRPRAAALQCLDKMERVAALGLPICVLPPLPRPDLGFLAQAGLTPATADPELLSVACSSACMWTANAATVIPASDSSDGRTHILPANLLSTAHRALEAAGRCTMLRRLFADLGSVVVHDPLPSSLALADEGAANHTRLQVENQVRHLFVYGVPADDRLGPPQRHQPRQTRAAQQACVRLAHLPADRAVFITQHPGAIDAGAFHNDVVMVGQDDRLLIHERAWVDQPAILDRLQAELPGLEVYEIAEQDLGLDEAVACYLFNSLLLPMQEGGMQLFAPIECERDRPRRVIESMLASGFIGQAHVCDLRQSMQGGGGPACLRLRVPLTAEQIASLPAGLRITPANLARLRRLVHETYPESLTLDELATCPVDTIAEQIWNGV